MSTPLVNTGQPTLYNHLQILNIEQHRDSMQRELLDPSFLLPPLEMALPAPTAPAPAGPPALLDPPLLPPFP